MPSPSSSDFSKFSLPGSPTNSICWKRSYQLLTPAAWSVGPPGHLDTKDSQPTRRWSSLTRLSCGADKNFTTAAGYQCSADSHGSLDRGLLHGYRKNTDLYLPLSSSTLSSSSLQRSPGAEPLYKCSVKSIGLRRDVSLSSALTSPMRHNRSYRASQHAEQAGGAGLICGRKSATQPDLTWLIQQVESNPKLEDLCQTGVTGAEDCGVMLSPWRQEHQHESGHKQMLLGSTLPVSTLKATEGLLRQREQEIDRQKQHILQLHVRIRENELRAQQVLQRSRPDEPYTLHTEELAVGKQPSDWPCCDMKELGRRLAAAELEVFHLNEFLKQVTQKYGEDIRKLEEKMRTRDRYISSLKKKCKREGEQNHEKQQRIETLEKYLADLPTLDEVQAQAQQQEEVQQEVQALQQMVCRLQRSLQEGRVLLKEKKEAAEMQTDREAELTASVHSLQLKVWRCLEDGVRFPVTDLKLLEVENTRLLEQHDHSSRLMEQQKERIESLTSQLKAISRRVHRERGLSHVEKEDRLVSSPRALKQAEMQEAGCLLKEMSLCLLDLQALCSILTQRAQGKQPNLSLLLGIKSASMSAEEGGEEEFRVRLLEVGRLRRDIEELRKSISAACPADIHSALTFDLEESEPQQ